MRRRFRRRPPLALLLVVGLILLVMLRISWDWLGRRLAAGDGDAAAIPNRPAAIFKSGPCTIVRVLAGDRLLVRQNVTLPNKQPQAIEGEVCLLGIQIAPTASGTAKVYEAISPAARRYADEFVRNGKAALELDKRRLNAEGCFLAYVMVDGQMLNIELVRQGLARVNSQPGDSATVLRLLRRAEDEARRARRGMWEMPATSSAKASDDP